jgi:hypothetical protein
LYLHWYQICCYCSDNLGVIALWKASLQYSTCSTKFLVGKGAFSETESSTRATGEPKLFS